MATLPRPPIRSGPISPGDVANAVGMLRFDRIVSVKWDVRPSIGIVAKDVERLGLDIRSFKEPLTRIVRNVLIPSFKKNFAEGGRPPWEPLDADTIRIRRNSAWPILVRSGKLRRAATRLNIWDIGLTTATIRTLPQDAFYGVYHQAGAGGGASGLVDELLSHAPGSHASEKLLARFKVAARKELGDKATDSHVHNRAVGLLLDASESTWSLPQRQFIMWQESDVPKMEAIFGKWMEERAIKVGRFNRNG